MATQISGDTGVSQVQDNTITSAKIVNGAVTPADPVRKAEMLAKRKATMESRRAM